ncbi:MAG: transcription antitermination factor NusB [Acidobacteria bacterium]|nr:MAG: transcription antitermination factor NusB [Acidobacteriota bacterium]
MGARRRGREAALRMLYQAELSGEPAEAVLRAYLNGGLSDRPLEPEARRFAERLFRGVDERRDELDALLRAGSAHWRLERMAVVDRNVLRLALFELLEERETPAAVILDEAVELAKLYGGEESGAFVNGVLDGIRRRLEAGELTRG